MPNVTGLPSFSGEMFHTARWRHEVDLTDRRVALVGTGPSAIQVAPAIQPIVRQLDIYQRSPGWTLPKMDFAYSHAARWWCEHVPLLQRLDRNVTFAIMEVGAVGMTRRSWLLTPLQAVARRRINKAIGDPDLRRKVTPVDAMGCKRLLLTDDWYSTLIATNVELVTDPLQEVKADSLVTANGGHRPADVLILATGFKTHEFITPMNITGAGGQTLASVWADVPRAYLGITVPGFPNMFLLHGPNTNGGTGSAIYMIEAMARHIVLALDEMVARSARSIEISGRAAIQFERELRVALDRTVWNTGCRNWYVDDAGNNASQWPWLSTEYRRRTGRVGAETYVFDAQPGDGATVYSVS
jgi:cation diffusion facilitator CzcD-associated flavoprotein CzcO